MNNIRGINSYAGPGAVNSQPPNQTTRPHAPKAASGAKEDQVEISPIAKYLSSIAAMPDIRTEKVERIRQALAEGSYDVNSRLDQALERLLDEHQP